MENDHAPTNDNFVWLGDAPTEPLVWCSDPDCTICETDDDF